METAGAWWPRALASAMFAAMTAVSAKAGLEDIDSDFATLVRTGMIAVVLGVLVGVLGKWRDPFALPRRSMGFLALSALTTGASLVCYYRALKLGDASRVAPVDKLSVVLVAIFAVVFLDERPSASDWIGIGMVTAGVIVLALPR